MVGGRSSDVNIPIDIKLEILKKLPAKSIVRFLCVSKLWKTIIRDYIVQDSIVIRSLTQSPRDPHFIFKRVYNSLPWSNTSPYNSPTYSLVYIHHQTTHEEEELLLNLDETLIMDNNCTNEFQYVRGLIGCNSSTFRCHRFTIYNPTTRQSVSLPNTIGTQHNNKAICFFFGYDPLSNQYKVMLWKRVEMSFQVYTLGDSRNQWRNIPCGIERHYPFHCDVCINGVIYYKALTKMVCKIILVSFDVGFERFNHVQTPEKLPFGIVTLVVYQGKLGCICKYNLDMDLWVLENAERQEWSKITFVDVFRDLPSFVKFAGFTHSGGEMVFVGRSDFDKITPIVYYYDTKLKKSRSFEIETKMSSRERISIFNVVSDHVENIMWLS